MKKLFMFSVCCLFFFGAFAQDVKKTKMLLLGCFHFDNPGLDVAKFDNANIMFEKRQQEVRDIVEKLKQFNPDKITGQRF